MNRGRREIDEDSVRVTQRKEEREVTETGSGEFKKKIMKKDKQRKKKK